MEFPHLNHLLISGKFFVNKKATPFRHAVLFTREASWNVRQEAPDFLLDPSPKYRDNSGQKRNAVDSTGVNPVVNPVIGPSKDS
jgi:hypothetical protein